eukprot:m.116846 g.116846  ORF g.116846 m.116846 type:complete len:70 (-) comp10931_c0_seq6:190-399(-)
MWAHVHAHTQHAFFVFDFQALYFSRCMAVADSAREIRAPPSQDSNVDVEGTPDELLARIRDISIVGKAA